MQHSGQFKFETRGLDPLLGRVHLILGRQNLWFSTLTEIYGSPNCVLLSFVGRQLPNVENHWSRRFSTFPAQLHIPHLCWIAKWSFEINWPLFKQFTWEQHLCSTKCPNYFTKNLHFWYRIQEQIFDGLPVIPLLQKTNGRRSHRFNNWWAHPIQYPKNGESHNSSFYILIAIWIENIISIMFIKCQFNSYYNNCCKC